MSIRSQVGNLSYNAKDAISTIVTAANTRLSNLFNTVTTGLGNLYSGGFVGMSQSGMQDLISAVNDYCDKIEAEIDAFKADGNRDDAYAGEINEAVETYLVQLKAMLAAYVSTMRAETEEAAIAYNAFHDAEENISQDVVTDSESVASEAESIRKESTEIPLE